MSSKWVGQQQNDTEVTNPFSGLSISCIVGINRGETEGLYMLWQKEIIDTIQWVSFNHFVGWFLQMSIVSRRTTISVCSQDKVTAKSSIAGDFSSNNKSYYCNSF